VVAAILGLPIDKTKTFDEENVYQVTITHGFREEYFEISANQKA
jgi:hypothetical protein